MPLLLCLLLAQAPPTKSASAAEVRRVTAAVIRAAEENAARRDGRLRGDALADFYVRRAAAAARADNVSPRDFLLALGIVFDHTNLLRGNPLLGRMLAEIENDAERKHRLAVLGDPTFRKRNDWLLHFTIAAALTAQLGSELAEQLSIAKELLDAKGASGFSFGDLAADYAGIAFAKALLDNENAAKQQFGFLADTFRGDDYLEANSDLEEGISLDRLTRDYGTAQDPRFRRKADAIRERVNKAVGPRRLRIAASPPP